MEKLKIKWKQHNLRNFVSKKVKADLKFVYSKSNTVSIIFSKNEDLLGVAGEFNNNIKELEKITNTSIYSRGNSIILKNDQKKMNLLRMLLVFYMTNILLMDLSKKKI